MSNELTIVQFTSPSQKILNLRKCEDLTGVHLEGGGVVVEDVVEQFEGGVEALDFVGRQVKVGVTDGVVHCHLDHLILVVQSTGQDRTILHQRTSVASVVKIL